MAVAEAIAHGLPVLTTRAGAVGEWLGRRGAILIPNGNVAQLQHALASLLLRPSLRASLRRGALARRRTLPRWETTARVVHCALAELLRPGGSRRREGPSDGLALVGRHGVGRGQKPPVARGGALACRHWVMGIGRHHRRTRHPKPPWQTSGRDKRALNGYRLLRHTWLGTINPRLVRRPATLRTALRLLEPMDVNRKSTITPQIVAEHGLTPDEYQRLLGILEREPSMTELGIFSVMWSEHCSYKSSRLWLKTLPTTGPQVIQGPGENAGVVDLGRW